MRPAKSIWTKCLAALVLIALAACMAAGEFSGRGEIHRDMDTTQE